MQALLDQSLKFLSYRPRSKKEVETFLRKKTKDDTLINQTITKLEAAKLINDEEFGRWVIESRSRSRPRGIRLLKQELKQKGVDTDINVDEVELAEKALEKKHC
ncbi:RecX family transcriptional regulator [Candidatus Amesbacteria bacterium]|nr:RecX family transcriptional regulator [Candidatus Amesbacteria bacterium]